MAKVTTEEHFGGCPTCGKNDGYVNVGRSHWFACDEHRVMWFAGSNLFSSWQDETEEEQCEQFKRIEDYDVVKPIYPLRGELGYGDLEKLRDVMARQGK